MNARGATFVEALVAIFIVGLAAAAMLPAFMTQLDANTRSGERTGAVSAAEIELEELRLDDPELMSSSGSSSPKMIVVGDHAYEVVTHYCERSELCGDTTRHIRVEVRLNGEMIHDVQTVFTQLR